MRASRAVLTRASAALDVVREGSLDGELALSYVIWPTPELEEASEVPRDRRTVNRDQRERALELVAGGLSWARAAAEVGVCKATVGDWVRRARIGAGVQVPPQPALGRAA